MFDVGVHLYVYVYICMYIIMYVTQKSLNGTLAVDSPFQTLAVDFSSNSLYYCMLQKRFPVEKIKDFLYDAHLALLVRRT